MAVKTNNLRSELPKNDFLEVDLAMFQGVEMPCEIIFYIPGIENSVLDEVAYVIFK
jgi:hypothetical protein